MIAEISAGAGAGGDRDQRGDGGARVGDEHLLAVDHPLVAVQLGPGAGGPGVGAGVRLGEPEGAQRPARHQVGEPLRLLLLGAEVEDGVGAQRHPGFQGDGQRRVDPGDLLDGDGTG